MGEDVAFAARFLTNGILPIVEWRAMVASATHRRTMAEEVILLTGASGYVGGRLLPILEASGRRLRCLARSPGILATRVAINLLSVACGSTENGSRRPIGSSCDGDYRVKANGQSRISERLGLRRRFVGG